MFTIMKKLIVFVAFFGLLANATPANAQTKRALVIGIGEQLDKAWDKINGDKDVPYVENMLTNANYEQVITLVNKQATKQNIVSAFNTIKDSCRENDIVYIHFSGHGQRIIDVNKDELDGFDESWVPYDAYHLPSREYRGEKHLVDDEINVLLTNICDKIGDGGKILVVVDACFSGAKREGDMMAAARAIAIKVKKNVPVGNMVVFAAAQSDETAYQYDGEKHGMFTYYLLKKLQETKGHVTLQELGNDIISNVRKQSIILNGKSQTPSVTPSNAVNETWSSWTLLR